MRHQGDALSAFVDGELSSREERRVLAHIEWCEECRDELGGIQEVRAAVRALPILPLRESVMAVSRPRRWARRLVVAAAALVAVVALVTLSADPVGQGRPLEPEVMADRHVARAVADLGPLPVRVGGSVEE